MRSQDLGLAIRRLVAAIDLTFCKLARIQFAAPWNGRGRGAC
jgi:hypothetical protein